MVKQSHEMRNHKNLSLIIPSNESVTATQKQHFRFVDSKTEENGQNNTDESSTTNVPKKQEETEDNKLEPVPFFKLFQYASGFEKCLMFLGFLCAVITGLMVPANIVIFGNLVGSMIDSAMGQAGSDDSIMKAVTEFALGNIIIGSILVVFTYGSVMLFNYTALKQCNRIRLIYLQSILHQDMTWYDKSKSGEVASRLTEDIIKYEGGINETVPMILHNIVAFVGCMVFAFVTGWKLALACLVFVPVMIITIVCFVRISTVFTKREHEVYAKASSVAEEVLSGIRTVTAFAGRDKELTRYTDGLQLTHINNIKQGLFSALCSGIFWLSLYSSYALSFWYGVTLILDDRHLPPDEQTYNAATMIQVFFSIMFGSINIGSSTPLVEAFGISKATASKVFSIIQRKPEIDSFNDKGETLNQAVGVIEFKNVSFEYPTRPEVKVLKNLSFTIKRGETVALVGNSGCGKSTCIQLLQRFYDPREGQVLLDGHNIKDLNIKWLRSCYGSVSQEPVLFDTTITENIRLGDIDASSEKIIAAAKMANAHDFITKLSNSYDTIVGEKGAQISGGQKQRIAIARALIKDPNILLLDEATSALDNRSESKVQAALDKAHKGRTTIIIAHRLSTIKAADKIIVMANGSVVEQGKHDELMDLKGHYYALVMSQISTFTNAKMNEVSDDIEDDEDVLLDVNKFQNNKKSTSSNSEDSKVSICQILSLNKKEWPYNSIACITSILVGCSSPLFAVIFGDLIGVLSTQDPDDLRSKSNTYCLYFVFVGVVIGSASFLQMFLFRIAGEKLTLRLRSLLFGAMLRQEVGWFDDPSRGTGALCAKLSTDAASVQGALGQRIGAIIQSCSTIGLSLVLAMYYEWRLGLLGMVFVPLILSVVYAQGLIFRKETLDYHVSLEASTKIAVEAVSNIRTVIGLCAEDNFFTSYKRSMAHSLRLAARNTHLRGLVFGLARSIGFFGYAACMYYGGYLVKNQGLFYADIFKVSQALIMGTSMVANALAFAPNLQKGIIAAESIINLMRREPKIKDPVKVNKDNWVSEATVDYKNVTFKYPTRPETTVLDDLVLNAPSGMTVALTGSSGCGKSTIIQLLERFYDPLSGTVAVSNTDIKNVTQSSLRKQLGLVSQEPTLFARTIAENIAYGDNDREVPMTEIIAAAKQANIHDFVSGLPLGYETVLGDKGTQLSGGQKQRIAIARSLIRNPKILLLDEATSALDAESEKIVQAALNKAKEGRTCLIIAHRLSTIEDADKICVIEKGKIVECGTHQELIKKKGMYYLLLCAQN